MRIIFINRFFYPDHSATSQLLTDLAFFLGRAGHEVHVICSRLRYDDPRARLPARERVDGVEVHRVWSSRFGRLLLPLRLVDYASFTLAALGRLGSLVRPGDLVVVKTDPPMLSIPVCRAMRSRQVLVVNWLQDLFPEVAAALGLPGFKGPLTTLLTLWRNRSLERAAANVVLGARMRERLLAEGLAPGSIRVIHNWAQGETLARQAAEAPALRRQWGLENTFVAAYSGNLGRAHDYRTMLDAARLLADTPGLVFLFIGGGTLLERLRREGEDLPNLRVLPYQPRERLGASLAVADVHLVCLRPELEGLIVPSKFYGIAAVARPTLFIGDPMGEIGAILAHAGAGLAVAPGEGRRLADILLDLRDHPDQVRRMGEAARATFTRSYTRGAACRQWLALIEKLAVTRACH